MSWKLNNCKVWQLLFLSLDKFNKQPSDGLVKVDEQIRIIRTNKVKMKTRKITSKCISVIGLWKNICMKTLYKEM